MKGKQLFEVLCNEIGAPVHEVEKVELQVYSNGRLHITGRAAKSAGRYADWALWGTASKSGYARTVKGLEGKAV